MPQTWGGGGGGGGNMTCCSHSAIIFSVPIQLNVLSAVVHTSTKDASISREANWHWKMKNHSTFIFWKQFYNPDTIWTSEKSEIDKL